MVVPRWLVVGLALTQMLNLSSQLAYDSLSFVEHRDDFTLGRGIIQPSESADGDDSNSEKGFKMLAPEPQDLPVECTNGTMKVELPAGPLNAVRILGSTATEPVLQSHGCGYTLTKTEVMNLLTVSFTGCHVTLEKGLHTVRLLYVTNDGRVNVNTVSCPAHQYFKAVDASPLSDGFLKKEKCKGPTALDSAIEPTPNTQQASGGIYVPSGCSASQELQIECGSGISASECLLKGCCVDSTTSKCHYPVNECTLDKHFVFVITYDMVSVPINPASLVIAGDRSCKPVVANSKFALFKFSVTKCGTRMYEVGDSLIYMAEVQTVIRALKMKYGIITRDNPMRFMVECRYPKTPQQDHMRLASVGFMVMSPILPSVVSSEGLYGVQLRIAKDESFSNFLTHYHQPLRLLLGKPVYLEVRIFSPKPTAVLLVHYCVAYPRSAKSALVLLYEGCPNALDSPTTAILHMDNLPQNRHTRRFVVKAFQFMEQTTNKFLNEEIYFMCSAEVCLSSQTTCKESCFDKKVSS